MNKWTVLIILILHFLQVIGDILPLIFTPSSWMDYDRLNVDILTFEEVMRYLEQFFIVMVSLEAI